MDVYELSLVEIFAFTFEVEDLPTNEFWPQRWSVCRANAYRRHIYVSSSLVIVHVCTFPLISARRTLVFRLLVHLRRRLHAGVTWRVRHHVVQHGRDVLHERRQLRVAGCLQHLRLPRRHGRRELRNWYVTCVLVLRMTSH